MGTYTTVSGDTWDSIAHFQMGDALQTAKLMQQNIDYVHYTIFPAGITLIIPEIEASISENLPPWKRAVD
ncbi:tail protein X [Lysinibacillus telephonicus]|uniref:Phage tail protein n=1 Tax=Lysinibacillus telephonicus TaxID=1714840 RepID=A0A3S0QXN9_9BACI|nr:tail protein X [Lysinibacillus telephonicus]RTQ95605.1 phage tail protein [Lysinibacillus telephonicus]